MATWRISGRVIDRQTRLGIPEFQVEAWDKDLLCNDLVGSATTDEQGTFEIKFDESYFRELFLERQPDLFFKVFGERQLIKSTEEEVLWNVAAGDTDITIEIDMTQATEKLTPDRRPITELQAKRLAALTDVSAQQLTGLSVLELNERFKFRIDPALLFFRRICGRVVKKDPDTGVEYPVPFATVHVEDTDCHLLGYFPPGWPWGWFFPLFCRREVIATVTTDACGRFCAYVPYWEIDWILRWRRGRICFPEIFIKPTIRDILEELLPEPPLIRPPRPQPDPVPIRLTQEGDAVLRQVEELLGRDIADQLVALESVATLGASTNQQQALLSGLAFTPSIPMPPPLPSEVKQMYDRQDTQSLAAHFSLDTNLLERFDPQRFVGPFRRCVDVLFPQWLPILDVPDITFRVTQDVDGDGNEETIYSEGFFDVRWNAGAIPDVTLEASPIAVAGVTCDTPEVICEDTPAILFAGLMPLINPPTPAAPYHDAATGYARRPNRPHPSGRITPQASDFPLPLAEAPYTKTLQLYGCNEVGGAQFYRLRYQHNGSPSVPFTGLTWPLHRLVGGNLQTLWPTSDANGWYPIIPAAQGWSPQNLLLNWPTGGAQFPNGLYTVVLELGNASKTVINTSAPVSFRIDNSRPAVQFTELRWRVTGGTWSDVPLSICPVITRPTVGGTPVDIEFSVSYRVSAAHLRSVSLTAWGCGGGTPIRTSSLDTAQHWHTDPSDNTVVKTATFGLSGSSTQGAYNFRLFAVSRSFNPSGGDGGKEADWYYDPVYKWVHPLLSVAVVNA